MALNFGDRLLTIVVTATLTSAAWIVVGSMAVERGGPVAAPASDQSAEPQATTPSVVDSRIAASTQIDGELIIPVENVRADQLVDSYSDERGAGSRMHQAIDIMASAGTPVVAAAPGTIEALFRSDDGGNTIYIRSDDRRTIHYYAHLQGYAPGLEEGEHVQQGQRIGFVGSTGNADPAAPHLHFAIMRTSPDADWWGAATAINPYPVLGGR